MSSGTIIHENLNALAVTTFAKTPPDENELAVGRVKCGSSKPTRSTGSLFRGRSVASSKANSRSRASQCFVFQFPHVFFS
jgi:hypothetical protein